MKTYTFNEFRKEYYRQFPNGNEDQLDYFWNAYKMMVSKHAT